MFILLFPCREKKFSWFCNNNCIWNKLFLLEGYYGFQMKQTFWVRIYFILFERFSDLEAVLKS